MADKKGRVLIVEDETFLRELYEELLVGDSYEVEVAKDGEEALAKVQDSQFDLTLLDIMLPKKDGLMILEETAQGKIFGNLGKVILLTNLGQDAVIKRGFELGAVGYLIKSAYTPSQILDEISGFLNKDGDAKSDSVPSGS
jgi:CheY-like chemotaxis protein